MTLRTQHELLAAAVNRSEALLSACHSANGDARRLASDKDLVEATESDTLTERHARSVARAFAARAERRLFVLGSATHNSAT